MKTAKKAEMISARAVERLSRYRSFLLFTLSDGVETVLSRQIADACGASAAQVRRDLMAVGCSKGGSCKGYEVRDVIEGIGSFFGSGGEVNAGIVGVGRLGQAIVDYLERRGSWVRLVAAFEIDPPVRVDRIAGVRRYPMASLETVIASKRIEIAILAIPPLTGQEVTDRLVAAGVRGIINYVPTALSVPEHVLVENIDMTAALEKVGYFAGAHGDEERP